jgi:hypothetical protein
MWTALVLAALACLGVGSEGLQLQKRVVFVSLQSYSIGKQELPVMKELRARGADVEFWGNSKLWKLMQDEGFK